MAHLLRGQRVVDSQQVGLSDEVRLGMVIAQIKVKPWRAGVHGIDPLDQFLSRLEEELVARRYVRALRSQAGKIAVAVSVSRPGPGQQTAMPRESGA